MTNAKSNRKKASWVGRVAIILLLSLVVLPFFSYWLRPATARWRTASAIESTLNGNREQAVAILESAVALSPDDWRIQLRLGNLLNELGRGQLANAICEKIITAADGGLQDERSRRIQKFNALNCKITAELIMGDRNGALASAKEAELLGEGLVSEVNRLNEIAYRRALVGSELGQATWAINKVLRNAENQPTADSFQPVSLRARGLLAAVLLSRRFNQSSQVIKPLNGEIEFLQTVMEMTRTKIMERAYAWIGTRRDSEAFPGSRIADLRLSSDATRHDLASLLLARALLMDDAKQAETSVADRTAAHQLGFDEQSWLAGLRTDIDCLIDCETAATFLDTNACVNFKSTNDEFLINKAIEEMDIAVACAGMNLVGWERDLHNQLEVPVDIRESRYEARRSLAVLLRHRQEMLRSVGKFEQAEIDLARINELGFETEQFLY